MPKVKHLFCALFILIGLFAFFGHSFADELSDIKKKIDSTSKKLDDLTSDKNALEKKIDDLTKNLSATSEDLKVINTELSVMEEKLSEINALLEEKRTTLSEKIDLRDKIVRAYYETSDLNGLEIFLLSFDTPKSTQSKDQSENSSEHLSGFQQLSQSYIAHKTLTEVVLQTIGSLNLDIATYEKNKKEAEGLKASLDTQKQKLSSLKASLLSQQTEAQEQLNSLADEIKKVNSSLAELSSKQQDLLKEKFGATSESDTVGDSEQSSSTLPDPPFKPAFAFFSYGYPHRVGASQYGMYGRAKAGQDYKEIITAYFKNVEVSGSCDKDKKIPVVGYGNLNLENTYLMGIAEIPESWGSKGGYEALKAQAVMARTYALNYTSYYYDSKSQSIQKRSGQVAICTTQSCQVYNGGKKTGLWKKAVEDTCGVTIKYKGNPITSWFASTAGGYTRTAGQVWGGDRPWTKGIRDAACSGNLFDCAYDGPKYGNSPWFHKAWGTNKASGNAWMKGSDVEDIFNAYLLSEKDSSYNKNLSPSDKGGWSSDKVKEKLSDLGIKSVGKISDISMKDDGTGYTTSVVLKSENYSTRSFDGYKFRSIFNLRSPGTLVIWTSFYDVLIE